MSKKNVTTNTTTDPEIPSFDQIEEYIKSEEARMKQRHEEAFRVESEQAWERSEKNRKVEFFRKYRDDYYGPWSSPYEDRSREDIYRKLLPKEIRLQKLLEEELYDQALRVFLYRSGGKATLSAVKKLFSPYIPVDGNEGFEVRKHGKTQWPIDGISPELWNILRPFDKGQNEISWVVEMVVPERFNTAVKPAGFYPLDNIYAPQRPKYYPSEEY